MLDTEVVNTFTVHDLEKLLKDLYGMDVNLVSEDFIIFEHIGQNTYHEWTVDGESELFCVGDKEIVAKWIETGEHRMLDMSDVEEFDWADFGHVGLEHIMHRLFIEGHIPAGKYLMKVYW